MIRKLTDGIQWKGNIYVALFKLMALLMALYSLCRVGFYLFNVNFFPNMTLERFFRIMLGGLKFDLTAILYLNALVVLLFILPFQFRFTKIYQQVIRYLFIGINALGLAANVADFIYYRFTLRRTTLSIVSQFGNEKK